VPLLRPCGGLRACVDRCLCNTANPQPGCVCCTVRPTESSLTMIIKTGDKTTTKMNTPLRFLDELDLRYTSPSMPPLRLCSPQNWPQQQYTDGEHMVQIHKQTLVSQSLVAMYHSRTCQRFEHAQKTQIDSVRGLARSIWSTREVPTPPQHPGQT